MTIEQLYEMLEKIPNQRAINISHRESIMQNIIKLEEVE